MQHNSTIVLCPIPNPRIPQATPEAAKTVSIFSFGSYICPQPATYFHILDVRTLFASNSLISVQSLQLCLGLYATLSTDVVRRKGR